MFEDELFEKIFFVLMAIIGFVIVMYLIHAELETHREIIKQSGEYVIYNNCEHIQGKYYCK